MTNLNRWRRVTAGLVIVGCVAVVSVPVLGQEHSVRPGVNDAYKKPDYDRWVAIFERPGREVYDRRNEIIEAVGVRTGMAVADIGAGTGLFTRLFARAVGPSGRVYAVDISRDFVENTLQRARERGFGNVVGVVNSATDLSLPAESVDVAFISNTYHHFEYPQKILQSIRRALRPTGALIIVDFIKRPGVSAPWIMGHVRAGREQVINEVESQGFRLAEDRNILRDNFFHRFQTGATKLPTSTQNTN